MPRKQPVSVTTHLVREALGLANEGVIDPKTVYAVDTKVPKKGSMH